MFALSNLTASANQQASAVLADGSVVSLTFRYRPAARRWTFDVAYKNFTATGRGLATHPNLLRAWRQIVPFGLQVVTADGTDPFLPTDVDASGGQTPRVTVNVLDSTNGRTDVADVEAASFS